MRLKNWHCLVLLALVTLAAYYPSLSAGFNSVDDLKMVNGLDARGPINLVHLFFPSGAYYYRPLTILTYLFDRDLWGSLASFMHLHNMLLHMFNALLVFAVSRRLLIAYKLTENWPALCAGLLFALHPLTVESVSWVSGRTDVLMTVFLLLGVWLALVGLQTGRNLPWLGAGLALFAAPMAKEIGVFIWPAMVWLILVYPSSDSWLSRLKKRLWPLVSVSLASFGYLFWRSTIIQHDSGVSTAVKGVTGGDQGQSLFEFFDKLRVALKVYGFYFKKLFVPWPLNFAIVEASDWYVLSGVLLLVLLGWLAWRRDVAGAFGLMAFCLLSPALLVIFGRMTWTPLAERYLYPSLAVFSPLVVYGGLMLRHFWSTKAVSLAALGLLLIFFATTMHRTWIWQDNVRLYRDTVAKSPNFPPARSELASALMLRGETEEAEKILMQMRTDSTSTSYVNDEINLASLKISDKNSEEARKILLSIQNNNPKKRFEVLQMLIKANDERLGYIDDKELRRQIYHENIQWLNEQYQLRADPFIYYRIAKQYFQLEDQQNALQYFKKAYAGSPKNSHYYVATAKFIQRIEANMKSQAD